MLSVTYESCYDFTEDGAPTHTASLRQNWCKRHFCWFFDKSTWPPSNPDISPISHIGDRRFTYLMPKCVRPEKKFLWSHRTIGVERCNLVEKSLRAIVETKRVRTHFNRRRVRTHFNRQTPIIVMFGVVLFLIVRTHSWWSLKKQILEWNVFF